MTFGGAGTFRSACAGMGPAQAVGVGGASCGGKASSVPPGVARCAFNLAVQGHPMRAAGAPFDFVGDPGPFWK